MLEIATIINSFRGKKTSNPLTLSDLISWWIADVPQDAILEEFLLHYYPSIRDDTNTLIKCGMQIPGPKSESPQAAILNQIYNPETVVTDEKFLFCIHTLIDQWIQNDLLEISLEGWHCCNELCDVQCEKQALSNEFIITILDRAIHHQKSKTVAEIVRIATYADLLHFAYYGFNHFDHFTKEQSLELFLLCPDEFRFEFYKKMEPSVQANVNFALVGRSNLQCQTRQLQFSELEYLFATMLKTMTVADYYATKKVIKKIASPILELKMALQAGNYELANMLTGGVEPVKDIQSSEVLNEILTAMANNPSTQEWKAIQTSLMKRVNLTKSMLTPANAIELMATLFFSQNLDEIGRITNWKQPLVLQPNAVSNLLNDYKLVKILEKKGQLKTWSVQVPRPKFFLPIFCQIDCRVMKILSKYKLL